MHLLSVVEDLQADLQRSQTLFLLYFSVSSNPVKICKSTSFRRSSSLSKSNLLRNSSKQRETNESSI